MNAMTSWKSGSVMVFALLMPLGAAGCWSMGATGDPSVVVATTAAQTSTSLPCDVEQVLVANCQECHGTTLRNGATMPLLTRDDLVAPAFEDPSTTYAAAAIAAMRADENAASAMPPAPRARAAASEIAVLEAWVNAGAPAATCTH